MNEEDMLVQGNRLIHEEAHRKHELLQWKHAEVMAKIESNNFCMADVVGNSVIFCVIGIVLGMLISAAVS